ncbi:disulfide isomerase [Idiomarina sp. OT37-5b]|jgi:thiol:disulfide interchange protein DsbA|uniref:Thiol:disulfide interchange protein n=1 Tax=Idiomarina aquatica TaxID=1327752 RepID=A0AA94EGZ9_9GAMM|nr:MULTISPECIES: thiol:disulfide interchange protein DsbA/DsbL [Idiomarina]AVJ57185.1 disulfide isomerase [Idiomarina sp. OT37-5b]RUO45711.1 disulfide isomerase [Idiomarina aquatica]
MSKWFLGLLSAALLVIGSAQAQQFEEGVHYETIADEATSKPEIVEFFSFYCVHCFRFEPIAKALKEAHPEAFEKAHVSFISPRGDVGETMTKAFAAAQKLDIEEKISDAIFDYNFNKNSMLTSKQDIRNVFVVNGVAGDEFDKALASFAVRAAASKMDRRASNLGVNATPTFIVNGKYKMLPQGFRDSEDFAADFTKLASYLIEK